MYCTMPGSGSRAFEQPDETDAARDGEMAWPSLLKRVWEGSYAFIERAQEHRAAVSDPGRNGRVYLPTTCLERSVKRGTIGQTAL